MYRNCLYKEVFIMAKTAKTNIRSKTKKEWPENCVWPKPLEKGEGESWDDDDVVDPDTLDEEAAALLEIKEYMDSLVDEGRLNSDYTLNNDFEEEEEDDDWVPECGEEYMDDEGFNFIVWQEDFSDHMNLLKLPLISFESSPAVAVREAIGYDFINENILRQAFTRRAFGIEYGTGNSETLEFIGDSILEIILTKTMADQFTGVENECPDAPFESVYDEGELTKIRTHFISKEYLAKRAAELELDQLILYGSNEHESESAKEDMMEALIGAVAIDSKWNWSVIESVVDRLITAQLTRPDRFLKQTYYDLFNAWHQKHFGIMPDYQVYGISQEFKGGHYDCILRFRIPENVQGIHTSQIVASTAGTRSEAREKAALRAYAFVYDHGLWIRLEDAHMTPSLENSINQLQELYQKKYIEELPQYSFEEWGEEWHCECLCAGVNGFGTASSKTKAKKKAAYMILVRLLESAGICIDEWRENLWKSEWE